MAILDLTCKIAGRFDEEKTDPSLDFVEVEKDGKTYTLSCTWESCAGYENEKGEFSARYKGVEVSVDGDEYREIEPEDIEYLKGATITVMQIYCSDGFKPGTEVIENDGAQQMFNASAKEVVLRLFVDGKRLDLYEKEVNVCYEF